jgi:hypothetical protein
MRGEADAANLTAAALALLEEIAAGLAGEARFKTLMAVAALKMAERERALATRLALAGENILLAGKYKAMEELREALRRRSDALTPKLHSALIADALVRTSVTKPGALTAEERELV